MQNSNKIALVTGATRGIGFETVRQLANQGVHVLLAGRDRGKAVEAALKLQAEGLSVEAITLDVANDDSIVIGTIRITASGSVQLSYSAASTRKASSTASGNTTSAALPCVASW